jgi:hypothetical protein
MTLHCPKCGSTRVRRGYEKPSLLVRLVGIHSLLCDSCNLSYRGFAIPGAVPEHSSRKSRYYRKKGGEAEPEEAEAASQYVSHEAGAQPSEVLSFAWYYLKLRVNVLLARHQTSHPLGIKYRWRTWQHWHRSGKRP